MFELLLFISFVMFVLATFSVPLGKVNALGAGLALWVAAELLARHL